MGTSNGTTAQWLLYDLLGSVVASEGMANTSIVDALRYDAYGQTLGEYQTTGTDLGVRFRGLIDLAPTADPDVAGNGSDPLYQMGARAYAPHLGTFTKLDTYAGRAQDPISLNRYLYAHANPATLIDPSGHCSTAKACPDGGQQTPDPEPVCSSSLCKDTTPTGGGQQAGSSGGGGGGGDGTSSTGDSDSGGADNPAAVLTLLTGFATVWTWVQGSVLDLQEQFQRECNPEQLTCTVEEFNSLTPAERGSWLKDFQRVYGTDGWLDALESFIDLATDRRLLGADQFIGQVDANVLAAIQDGMALYLTTKTNSDVGGASEFGLFFRSYYSTQATPADLTLLGIEAEQAAVDAGVAWATAEATHEDRFLLGGADAWRAAGRAGVGDVMQHYGLGDVGHRVLTPRSNSMPSVVNHYQSVLMPLGGATVAIGDVANHILSFSWLK